MTKLYKVYLITHKPTGKKYVGLTQRSLQARFNAHFYDAMRIYKENKGVNTHGLKYIILTEIAKYREGSSLNLAKSQFDIELLEDYDTVDDMKQGEIKYINEHNTLAPNGLNLAKGGISAGGVSNSQPIDIYIKDKLEHFPSHSAFFQKLAEDYGINKATIKYRFDKIKKDGDNDILEFGDLIEKIIMYFEDSRKTGGTNQQRQKRTREQFKNFCCERNIDITNFKYPNDNNEFTLSSKEFAQKHGLVSSTVRNRLKSFIIQKDEIWNLINNKGNDYLHSKFLEHIDELKEYLVSSHQNNIPIKFILPNKDKEEIIGDSLKSILEIIKNRNLMRENNIGISAIKKRYQKYDNKLNINNNDWLYIFGFLEEKPDKLPDTISINIEDLEHRNKLMDYSIDNITMRTQGDFVEKILPIIKEKSAKGCSLTKENLQGNISNYAEKHKNIDGIISSLENFYKIQNLKEIFLKKYT